MGRIGPIPRRTGATGILPVFPSLHWRDASGTHLVNVDLPEHQARTETSHFNPVYPKDPVELLADYPQSGDNQKLPFTAFVERFGDTYRYCLVSSPSRTTQEEPQKDDRHNENFAA